MQQHPAFCRLGCVEFNYGGFRDVKPSLRGFKTVADRNSPAGLDRRTPKVHRLRGGLVGLSVADDSTSQKSLRRSGATLGIAPVEIPRQPLMDFRQIALNGNRPGTDIDKSHTHTPSAHTIHVLRWNSNCAEPLRLFQFCPIPKEQNKLSSLGKQGKYLGSGTNTTLRTGLPRATLLRSLLHHKTLAEPKLSSRPPCLRRTDGAQLPGPAHGNVT